MRDQSRTRIGNTLIELSAERGRIEERLRNAIAKELTDFTELTGVMVKAIDVSVDVFQTYISEEAQVSKVRVELDFETATPR